MRRLGLRSVGVAAGSLAARIAVLVFLAALARAFDDATYHVLLFGVGVGLAAQVVLDPSSIGMYLLRDGGARRRSPRRGWDNGLRLAVPMVTLVALLPAPVVAISADPGGGTLVAVAALGVLAACESLCRYGRWSWQADERFPAYIAVDGAIGLGRLALAAVALLTGSLTALAGACAAVGLTLVLAVLPRARPGSGDAVEGGEQRLRELLQAVLPYAGSMALSAGYSQAPTVLTGVRAGVATGALFTGATRVTQPTELLPASIAAAFLPRLVRDPLGRARLFRTQAAIAAVVGVLVGAVVVAVAPVAASVLKLPESGLVPTLTVLAAALPFKFVNYQLVAYAVATGRIASRLRATAVVAVVSVVVLWFVTPSGGRNTAFVVLGAEISLMTILSAIALRARTAVREETSR